MPLFLESYTIPSDLPQQDLVRAMRTMNRGTDIAVLRCAYDLAAGKAWTVTEAGSEDDVRRSFLSVEFPLTLDTVAPVSSPAALDALAQPDFIFEPSRTRPADAGAARGDSLPPSRPAAGPAPHDTPQR